jgi:branched-chain amino acid transport system permease protein
VAARAEPASHAPRDLRGQWRAMSEKQRWAVEIGAEVVISILAALVADGALGYAFATIFACLWFRRMPPLPWRLLGEVVLVGIYTIGWIAGVTPGSVPLVFLTAFAITWIPGRQRAWGVPVACLLVAVAYPFFAQHLFSIPFFGAFPDVYSGTATYMMVFMMMAVGLNIVVGYAGLLDLGYVAFYAIGAYVMGWLASGQFAGQKCSVAHQTVQNCTGSIVPARSFTFGGIDVPTYLGGVHISIFLVLAIAGVVTALFGTLIGLPTLRLRGDYLAIVTLGFGEILPQVARNGSSIGGFNITNGALGINPVDTPGFGGHLSKITGGVLPASFGSCCKVSYFGHQISTADLFYWFAIILLIFTVFCSLRLRDSRLGRAWIAIREDETAAAAMGIPLMRTKTWAYAGGAFFGGVAGAYYASVKDSVSSDDFYFNISVFILCMVILGGMGNVWGVLAGAAFLAYLNKEGLGDIGAWINSHVHAFGWHANVNVPEYESGIYGVIIVAVMLVRPEGLFPSKRRAREFHEAETHDQPLYDVQHEGS